MKRLLWVFFLSVTISFASASVSHSQYMLTQLVNSGYRDGLPQINDNGYVVWYGCDGADCFTLNGNGGEIFLYDGTSTTQLTNNDYADMYPQMNSSGHAVWMGYDGEDWEIFLYDGTSTTQLTHNAYDDLYPQINDNGFVVWMSDDSTDSEIFLYDGTDTTQLTHNAYEDLYPQINNNGFVVWYGGGGASGSEIFLYNGADITQLTDNDSDDESPQIGDNGHVVWMGDDGEDWEIFLYDGTSTTQLTNNTIHDNEPQINDAGSVVWYGGGGVSGFEIFLYDGTSTTLLTPNSYLGFWPQINNSRFVVYGGLENPGWNTDIFLAIPCAIDDDHDDDGYLTAWCGGDDCNDSNPNVNPGVTESLADENCGDAIDNDCDELIDDGDPSCWECTDAGDCSDNNLCADPTCVDHECRYIGISCDDSNECTDDSCHLLTGCVNKCNATDPTHLCCQSPACQGDSVCSTGTCVGSAGASTHGPSRVYGSSDLKNHLASILFPVGAVIGLMILRRRK